MFLGILLTTPVVFETCAAGVVGNEKRPDSLSLLKGVAQARLQVTSGAMEFEVNHYMFDRPQDGTNRMLLKAVFDGDKRRLELVDREYSYVFMGPDAAQVTDAKMSELKLDREAAVREGLLTGFESRHTIAYDGTVLMDYWANDGKPVSTSICNPARGSSTYAFDPRVLGLTLSPFVTDTVEKCLAYHDGATVRFMGQETVEGIVTWHVRAQSKSLVNSDFWIDAAHPNLVVKHVFNGNSVVSKYDPAHPEDPMPTEVHALDFYGKATPRDEVRFRRLSRQVNIPVDPVSWTLAGLNMPVGTEVTDTRISRRIGYWNGTGLSENPPPRERPTAKPQIPPDPGKLLGLAEKDVKSPFALEAATWILLNTPDGPQVEKAAELIRREHLRNTNLVYLCQGLERLRHRCSPELLRAVLDNNPEVSVRAQACFALATLRKSQANAGADEAAAVEAERLFERVQAEFGQVEIEGTLLADRAKPELAELRRLGVGKEAPEIEGEDLEGRKLKLSDFRGRVVVLTFWGTWCGPCMQMVPEERKLVERLAGKPFALVGINSDRDPAKVKAVAAKEQITWRSFRDGEAPGPIATAWNVHSWPTIYVLDPKGVIRYRNVRGQALADAVDALLARP